MAVDISDYVANQYGATNTIEKANGTDALSSGQANMASSYETFLKLLTVQLKNQDPTSPLDTNAFTQQLVQMTGVQQQLLSNQLLQQLVAQSGGDAGDAVNLIGKTVTAVTDSATLKDGKAEWGYELGSAASKATITITDSNNRTVYSGSVPDLSKGAHDFAWDGKGSMGQAPDGQVYRIKIEATDANGSTVPVTTTIKGQVTSLRQDGGLTLLKIGGSEAPLGAVSGVSL